MDGDLPSYPTIPSPSTTVSQPIFRDGYEGPSHVPMVPLLSQDMPPSSILPPGPAMGTSPQSSLLPTQPVSNTGLLSQQMEEPIYSTVVKPPKQTVSLMGGFPPPSSSTQLSYAPAQSLPLATTPVESNLPLRIQYLESLCVSMQKEKKALGDTMRVKEEEFGKQRKKFMNQMMEKEAEVGLSRQTVEKFSNEVQELSTQLLQRDEELKNIGMVAQLTDASSREAFDVDRVKYEEEIASLQKILKEQTLDSAQDLKEVKEAWQREKHALGAQIGQLRNWLGLAPKLNLHDPQDSLETSMRKATEDTKLLRSVVLPLEEEIEKLKHNLREAEERLKAYGGQSAVDNSMLPLIDLDGITSSPGKPENRDLLTSSPTEPLQLQQQLDLERTARHDLEMHIEQLKRQKAILQEEFVELKGQIEKVRTDYEKERLAHAELKKTWELANQHFIVAQDQLKQQIYNLEQTSGGSPMLDGPEDDGIVIKAEEEGTGLRKIHSSENMETPSSPTTDSSAVRSASWSSSLSQLQAPPSSLEERVASMEAELSQLHRELSRRVQMCANYESQLQRVQEQMVADMDEKERSMDRLRAECEKYKAAIMRERKLRNELRVQMGQAKEEMTARIEAFSTNEHELSQVQKSLRDCFTEAKHDAQREVARFSDDRVKLYGQIEHTREEYECLKVLQSQQMADYQEKLYEMEQACQEARSKYSQTMEELTSFRDQTAEVEDDLCNQIAALKEQSLSEQSHKDKLEASLTQQLIEARKENVELQGLKDEAGRERIAKEEALASRFSIQEKSKSFIEEQQRQLEQLSLEKESAEQQVRDLQRQVSSLRSQLNHTEATQKDFVQLSQTLQVRIAEMEEQQSEDQLQRCNSGEDTPT